MSKTDFFKGVTAPRNKELIRVFKDVDLIENIGPGILRILKDMNIIDREGSNKNGRWKILQ